MKKDRWLLRAVVLLALSAGLMTTASLAAEAGSAQDPLVTLSYLNDTFVSQIMQRGDLKIAERTLTGDIGCEVMLRVGSAVCVAPSDPGLIDETSGSALANGGSLVQNHLYMMTIEGRGVRASAGTVKVMARGSYTVA